MATSYSRGLSRFLTLALFAALALTVGACSSATTEPVTTEPLSAEEAISQVGVDELLGAMVDKGLFTVRIEEGLGEEHVICDQTFGGGKLFNCCPMPEAEFHTDITGLEDDEIQVDVRPRCPSGS